MERSVIVRLRAEMAQYLRDMGLAQRATEAVGKAWESVAKDSRVSGEQMAKSARDNKQAWTEAGQGLAAVGGALTGTTALIYKQGIAYNTLQQQSRAALSTLLGGATAANVQMDKLDAFARNSPFSKQTFISAQQQMLAFGYAAEDVVPVLGAVEDAVAAAGGTAQTLSEIVFVMSQIRAAGKVTAVDLMQLAQRGINAAELIGSQMGMTGVEVKESITAGALDAGQALDALAAGMEERFGGAAANVKDTMVGATDRVKAAFRDLASDITEPFVSKNGGGILVDQLNNLADVLRQLEDLPKPIAQVGAALTGTVGLVALAAGGFLLLAPRILATRDALRTLRGPDGLGITKQMVAMRAGALGLATVLGMLQDKADAASPALGALNSAATGAAMGFAVTGGPWGAAIGGAIGLLGSLVGQTKEATGSIQELTATLDAQTHAATQMTKEYIVAQLQASGVSDQIQEMGISLADVANAAVGNEDALSDMFGRLAEGGLIGNDALNVFGQLVGQYEEGSKQAKEMADSQAEFNQEATEGERVAKGLSDRLKDLSDDPEAAQKAMTKLRDATMDAADGFLQFGEKIDPAKASLRTWMTELEKQAKAQRDWADNMVKAIARGVSPEVIEQFQAQGAAGAARLAQLVKASDQDIASLNKTVHSFSDAGERLSAIKDGLRADVITKFEVIGGDDAIQKATEIARAYDLSPEQVETVLRALDWATPDIKGVLALLDETDTKTANPTIMTDDERAKLSIEQIQEGLAGLNGSISQIFLGVTDEASGTIEDVQAGQRSLDGSLSEILLGATDDATPMIDQVGKNLKSLDGKSAWVNVYARTGAALAAIAAIPGVGSPISAFVRVAQLASGGGATGTRVPRGFAGGGRIPGRGPGNPWIDDRMAFGATTGEPFAVRSGEWIVNEQQSEVNDHWIAAINDGLNMDNYVSQLVAAARRAPGDALGTGVAYSMAAYVPAPSGPGATAVAAPSHFTGDLYLDSGEWVGAVRGIARAEVAAGSNAAARTAGAARRRGNR